MRENMAFIRISLLGVFFTAAYARYFHCNNDGFENAICHLRPNPSGPLSNIEGTVLFTQLRLTGCDEDPLVGVHVNITGLPQVQHHWFRRHGFHIHERGDLTNGCQSMGGHYNPDNSPHGSPADTPSQRHVGDLGNAICDRAGNVRMDYYAPDTVTLFGERTIVGRGVVLHELEDDLGRGDDAESTRTGNAGSRIACCIIESLPNHP